MQKAAVIIARLVVAYSMMTVTGSVALAVRLLTLGSLTDVCRRYIVAPSSRMILRLIGVHVEMPLRREFPSGQVMYTFNHNSYLDVLLVTALGLEGTRFFLSERTLKFVPVTISALAIGTLYIPQQKHAERRERFFRRTTERIRREGFSVFVSSEGVHTFVHGIAPFNLGVYRMAVEASLPIVPVYFHIPRHVNSLEGYSFTGGTVRIEVLPTIDTSRWRMEQIEEHVADVRNLFIRTFNESHGIHEAADVETV